MSCRSRGALMAEAMEQENDDVPQDGHCLRRRSLPDSAGIFAERSVAHSVQAVLDPPVAASQPQERLDPDPLARQARDPQHHLGLDLLTAAALPRQAED